MGAEQSIMVASAFPQDIYVKARSERITSLDETFNCSGQAGSSSQLPPQVSFSLQAKNEKRAVHEVLIQAGFCLMQKCAISSFRPPPNHTKTVYVTVLYYDCEGNERKIAEDVPYHETQAVIVTATGGIVNAKGKDYPWIDLNGVDHKMDPCEQCAYLLSICPACTVQSRFKRINDSIGEMQQYRIAKLLVSVIEIAKECSFKGPSNEAEEIIQLIENLAKCYWKLETKTKRAVGSIKVYGISCKNAAQNFLEDGNLSDFFDELSDMDEEKKNLHELNEQHGQIKGAASALNEIAANKAKMFTEKVQDSIENSDTESFFAAATVPVFGQVFAAIELGVCVSSRCVESCKKSEWSNNVLVKTVSAAVSGVVVGAAGLVGSALYVPLGPYFWFKAIDARANIKNYKSLETKFSSIAVQMGMIDKQLGIIDNSLHDIEQSLHLCQRAENRFFKDLKNKDLKKKKYSARLYSIVRRVWGKSPEKQRSRQKRKAESILEEAEKLVHTCDKYFSMVDERKNQNFNSTSSSARLRAPLSIP